MNRLPLIVLAAGVLAAWTFWSAAAGGADRPFGRPFLANDYGGNKVALVRADDTVEWEFPARNPQDIWLLKSGNILFCHVRGAREVTRDKKVVWEYNSPEGTEVQACQPLPDGSVLVVECGTGRLLEVGRDGRIAKEIKVPLKTTAAHQQMRGARKTADGRYLVCAKGDQRVLELDATGKLLREIPIPGDPHEVVELPNKHLLIACGDGHSLIELDAAGKPVWTLGENDIPGHPLRLISGFHRLPDGNTIIVNWLGHGHLGEQAQFFEVTPDKKLVREFLGRGTFTSISKVQILDVPGDADPAKSQVLR